MPRHSLWVTVWNCQATLNKIIRYTPHNAFWRVNEYFAVSRGVHSFRNILSVIWPSLVHEGQLICELLSIFFSLPDLLCEPPAAAEWHQLQSESESQIPCRASENLHCQPNISSVLRRSLPTFSSNNGPYLCKLPPRQKSSRSSKISAVCCTRAEWNIQSPRKLKL